MNRYFNKRIAEYRIAVTVKNNRGSFGSKRGPRQEFWFCAEWNSHPTALVAHNVRSLGYPYDDQEVQVLSCIPVATEQEPEEVFPMVGSKLRSLSEAHSDEELEYV